MQRLESEAAPKKPRRALGGLGFGFRVYDFGFRGLGFGVWVEGLPPLRLWGFPKIGRPQNRTLNSGILITRTPK